MSEKSFKSFVISFFLCTFAPDNEPLKQAGGSASSGLTIRISRQNTEIRRFPVRNFENCVIFQASDKQIWFEFFFQSYENSYESVHSETKNTIGGESLNKCSGVL